MEVEGEKKSFFVEKIFETFLAYHSHTLVLKTKTSALTELIRK
jgi:hypothetical protein